MNEEINTQVEPVTEETQEQVQAVQQQKQDSDRERNFKVMRERAEQAERRARELEQQYAPKPAVQAEDDFGIEDDSLIEGKHLKKYVRSMQEQLKQTKQQLDNFNMTSAEMQLKNKFNDFDAIVTDENLQRLAQAKPSLYRSIQSNPDLRDKGETAYDAIKMFLQPAKFESEDKRIEENRSKPRNAATVNPQASDSPLSRTGDYDRRVLTEARKDELYREMLRAKELY